MGPSASQSGAQPRRREIELAFAYLFGPVLLGQRIALDVLTATIATAAVPGAGHAAAADPQTADQPSSATPRDVRLRPTPRATLKVSYGGPERSGAAASPP